MTGVGRKPNPDPSLGVDRDHGAYAAMIARAAALVPQLRERAPRTEELRRLPPETERDLHDAGLFRILQPKRVGGSEFDYVALVDCADALGRGDASVAWNFANLASHHWMLAMFDKQAQDLVWNKSADALIASSFIFPAGRARKVDGGLADGEQLEQRPGGHARRADRLGGRLGTEHERDGELVGPDRLRVVAVVVLGEGDAQPVVDDRPQLLQRVKHRPGGVAGLAVEGEPDVVFGSGRLR